MEPFIARNVKLAVERMREEVGREGYTDVFKWFIFMVYSYVA